ncbi:S-layer homology domain-containing protein, partial [Cohnella faecalis]
AWTDVTGTEIDGLAAGTYYIRVKATATSFQSAEQTITITALTPGAEAMPTIEINYADEQLTGFMGSGSYTIDGTPVAPVSGKLDVASYLGTTIAIVKKGNGTTTVDSEAQDLFVPARPATPTSVGVNPTIIGGTGKITGVTVTMEYKASAGAWTDVTGTEIDGLAAGTYYIRVKATATSFRSVEQIVTLTDPAPVTHYTVTVINGGTGASGSGDYASGDTVSIQAGTRRGYSFNGWTSSDGVTFADASGVATTFAMLAHNVTVTATWSGNGGSGGGSSSTAPSMSITIDKKPSQPTSATTSLNATVDENGNASVTLTESQVKALIDAAKEDAQNKGNTVDGIGIACNIQFGAAGISFSVKLEEGALALLEKEGVKRFAVNTSLVSSTFDQTAIQEMKSQASGDVTITASPVTKLSDAARVLIGSRPVYEITVSYQKNGKTEYVTNFGKGTVTLGFSYKVDLGEKKTVNLYAVYVNKDGKPQILIRSRYDNGKLAFSRNSLSIYGVGYLEPARAYSDTAKHWAKENIDFVVSRGLIAGTSTETFSPNTAITRGDFLMALGKLSGVDMSGYKQSSFTDVSSTNPAMPYIEWAVQNKIVQGVGNNRFSPDSPITREQMAVMMAGFTKVIGYKLPVSRQTITFADGAKISSWAKEAVKAIQQTGVVEGKDNNRFDPAGNATRAEASTILRRFVEFVIDEGTPPLEI